MWTPAKFATETTAFISPRRASTLQLDGELARILNFKEQYHDMFDEIYDNQQSALGVVVMDEHNKKNKIVKQSVTQKLRRRKTKNSFMEKFSLPNKKQKER